MSNQTEDHSYQQNSLCGVAVLDSGTWDKVGRIYKLVFPSGKQTSICVAYGSNLEDKVKLAVERLTK